MLDLLSWWAKRLPLPEGSDVVQTAEPDMPWLVYTYGRVHDGWWPLWRSSRLLGRTAIGTDCAICGESAVAVIRLPRYGPVSAGPGGPPAERLRFLRAHVHEDRAEPTGWTVDRDALAMRLEAELVVAESLASGC